MFFHALTFAGSQGCCLKTRPIGRVFKHLPRNPASVNAMKQTCVIVILAYLTLFQPNLRFSKQNGVGCVLSNAITSSQRHSRTQRFREQKHLRNDQSGPQRFPYNVMQMMEGSF